MVFAIQMAESELNAGNELFCLGDIVHNNMEVERLTRKGLKIIDHDQLKELHDCKVLIRAHGEPPETYEMAIKNNIELIDASCPVVLKLQNRVRTSFDSITESEGQVVIYGEIGHAEVNGLVGQTGGKAVIITGEQDLDKLDYSRPIYLFSQTTKSSKGFQEMRILIENRIKEANNGSLEGMMNYNDTICRQVSNREPQLRKFSAEHDVILFVSGKKSSNGKALFGVCQSVNPNTYFISDTDEIDAAWLQGADTVGVCGATSTPMWLMEDVATKLAILGASSPALG